MVLVLVLVELMVLVLVPLLVVTWDGGNDGGISYGETASSLQVLVNLTMVMVV